MTCRSAQCRVPVKVASRSQTNLVVGILAVHAGKDTRVSIAAQTQEGTLRKLRGIPGRPASRNLPRDGGRPVRHGDGHRWAGNGLLAPRRATRRSLDCSMHVIVRRKESSRLRQPGLRAAELLWQHRTWPGGRGRRRYRIGSRCYCRPLGRNGRNLRFDIQGGDQSELRRIGRVGSPQVILFIGAVPEIIVGKIAFRIIGQSIGGTGAFGKDKIVRPVERHSAQCGIVHRGRVEIGEDFGVPDRENRLAVGRRGRSGTLIRSGG